MKAKQDYAAAPPVLIGRRCALSVLLEIGADYSRLCEISKGAADQFSATLINWNSDDNSALKNIHGAEAFGR
jgi:hypothetical protein